MKKQLLIACMVVLCGCVNEPPKAQTAKKLNEWRGIPTPMLPARDYTKQEHGDEWLTDTLKKWRDFYMVGTELLQIHKSRVRVMFEIIELDTEIQEMSASMLNSGLNAWMLKEVKRKKCLHGVSV